MKHAIILLLILSVSSCTAQTTAQKYILTSGSTGYVTIQFPPPSGDNTPQDYTRFQLQTQFWRSPKGDTQMSIYQTNGVSRTQLVPYTTDSNYQIGNSGNANFPSTDSLYRWCRKWLNNSN